MYSLLRQTQETSIFLPRHEIRIVNDREKFERIKFSVAKETKRELSSASFANSVKERGHSTLFQLKLFAERLS